MCDVKMLMFSHFRSKATGMNSARSNLTACVVKGLPNARDYAYKNMKELMGQKRQREMALEMGINRKEQEKQEDPDVGCVSDEYSRDSDDDFFCIIL
jgi:hypothetical protein